MQSCELHRGSCAWPQGVRTPFLRREVSVTRAEES